MFLGVGALSLLFSIYLCVHVVRTGQSWFWLWIILILQPLGGLVYLAAVIAPPLLGGRTARRLGAAARETLDPHREYREAKADCDDAPTVRNQSRLAAAAAELGRHEEAERLYAAAAQGVHVDDPTLNLGRAKALLDLGRAAEALPILDRLQADPDQGRAGALALARARALEAAGRLGEAEQAYRAAVESVPGFEALGRQGAFLARSGRTAEARDLLADLDRRIARTSPQFRREARHWRDLIAEALGRA